MPARSAAAGAAALPADLPRVPDGASVFVRAPGIPPDSDALMLAERHLRERLKRQPRAEREILRAVELVHAALECVALAELRLERLAR